jgi:hypothetical protein
MFQRSKFYGIKFPAFGLLEVPFDYKITLDTIEVQKKEFGKWHLIDRFDKDKSALERYLKIKEEEFTFDVTCLNVTHLISKRVKWVIDANCRVFNLAKPQTFKARNVPIIKTRQDIFWVATVSYPFKIKKGMIDPKELLNQHITIVYIDYVWHLYRFSSFKNKIESISL